MSFPDSGHYTEGCEFASADVICLEALWDAASSLLSVNNAGVKVKHS